MREEGLLGKGAVPSGLLGTRLGGEENWVIRLTDHVLDRAGDSLGA